MFEEAFFFGARECHAHDERLFGVLHRPGDRAPATGGAWLFCSPFGDERGNAQRLMVEWARRLSNEGHTVLRFDYRGTGDSAGRFEQHTLDDYVADVQSAATELTRRCGMALAGLCGIRLGATVAALAALRHGWDIPLLLWEPIVKGEAYGDELLRAVMAKQMANSGQAPMTRVQLKERMAQGGEVAVDGHILSHAFFQTLASVDLVAAGRPGTQPIRIVNITARARARIGANLEALQSAYAEIGPTTLESACVPVPWVLGKEYDVRPERLFEPSLAWMAGLAPAAEAQSPAPPHAPGAPRAADRLHVCSDEAGQRLGTETFLEFDIEGARCGGVLHQPANAGPPGRPVVMLLSIANNCRTANAQFYVKLGRLLAARGWTAFRFDPRGCGDSEGHLPYALVPELYLAIEQGLFVPDAKAAMAHMASAFGALRFILTGICGGSTTALFEGADDPRVAGIAPLELTFRNTPQPGLDVGVESFRRSLAERLFGRRTPFRVALKRRLKCWRRHGRDALRRFHRHAAGLCVSDIGWFVGRLGPRPNIALFTAFLRCLGRRIPMLCIYGETFNTTTHARIRLGLAREFPESSAWLDDHTVAGADHVFSMPAHAQEVFEVLLRWLENPEQPWNSR